MLSAQEECPAQQSRQEVRLSPAAATSASVTLPRCSEGGAGISGLGGRRTPPSIGQQGLRAGLRRRDNLTGAALSSPFKREPALGVRLADSLQPGCLRIFPRLTQPVAKAGNGAGSPSPPAQDSSTAVLAPELPPGWPGLPQFCAAI